MSNGGLDSLKKALGPAAAKLPDLQSVPDSALIDFAAAVSSARSHQKQLLEDSANHSLRLVPALLRPVVRKVLFG